MLGYASLYIHMHNNAQESSKTVWKLEQNSEQNNFQMFSPTAHNLSQCLE